MTTGSVNAQGSITSRDIITGLKIDNLTVVLNSLDQLAALAGQSELKFRPQPDGGVELVTPFDKLRTEGPLLVLPPNLVQAYRQLPQAGDLSPGERYRCYAGWLLTYQPVQPPAAVAARDYYIPLPGFLSWDWADDLLQGHLCELTWVGEGPQRQLKRERLDDVAEAVQKFPAFVLLGPPGSGKSTVLRRLVRAAAQEFLAGHSPRLPLLLELGSYHWERQAPEAFAGAEWAGQVAADFVDLARQGRLLLLADGLNEMPYLSPLQAGERADDWRRFIAKFFAEATPGSGRAILASRDQSDYEQPLGLPRVEIEPLEPEQIARFAAARLANQAEAFLAAVERFDLWPLARVPISLFFLTQLFDPSRGDLPANKGRLFRAYADLLWRQVYPKAPTAEREAHLAALAELGYAMQQRGESTVLPAGELRALLPPQVRLPKRSRPEETPPELVFERAWRSGLLSQVSERDETYKFGHQLLQEQFAARQLLARWQAGEATVAALWRTPRTHADMPAPQGGDWEPLPPPPPTRWEQTTLLAAGMTGRPDDLVRAVLAVNPALAGRCLSEGGASAGDETRAAVQQALLQDLSDPALHRRARSQAGRVLGAVGDPRLTLVSINGVEVILPDFVAVPGGTATLGSVKAEAYEDEQPVHQVDVAAFYLGRWPVTNAEYGCFRQAGGYDNESYWTPAGWQWRQGQLTESGPVEEILQQRRYILENPGRLEQLFGEGRLTPQARDTWQALAEMSEEEAQRQVSAWYPLKAHEQPYYWDDPTYNGLNQPVVGVTWYEAMAYCAWLNEQLVRGQEAGVRGQEAGVRGQGAGVRGQSSVASDQAAAASGPRAAGPLEPKAPCGWAGRLRTLQAAAFGLPDEVVGGLAAGTWQARLPTEAEWERAAGGLGHSRYPWGLEFDPDQANTLDGRILGTTPVGTYPAGAATCGALDLAGNVYEWTHSLYQPYPYRTDDGQENRYTDGRRTLRGGSWYGSQGARARVLPQQHPTRRLLRRYRVSVSGSPCLFGLGFWLLAAVFWFLTPCFRGESSPTGMLR